jgi:hypothetical protein
VSIKRRVERAENSFADDCLNHYARLWREGEQWPTCAKCGALFPVVKAPPKLSRDEWIARAADFATLRRAAD